jgi:hypothetical protein
MVIWDPKFGWTTIDYCFGMLCFFLLPFPSQPKQDNQIPIQTESNKKNVIKMCKKNETQTCSRRWKQKIMVSPKAFTWKKVYGCQPALKTVKKIKLKTVKRSTNPSIKSLIWLHYLPLFSSYFFYFIFFHINVFICVAKSVEKSITLDLVGAVWDQKLPKVLMGGYWNKPFSRPTNCFVEK